MASVSIDVPGTFKNMLHDGFSTENNYMELVDDSLGAGAKTISFILDDEKKQLMVADDGCGMTRPEMAQSHTLNRRSDVSNKHGRFGIGRKHAMAHFTQLKGEVHTISRSSADGHLSQMNIDFNEVLSTGTYCPSAHGIESEFQPIWDANSVNKDGSGTMTIMDCEKDIYAEFTKKANSSLLEESILYNLGLTYHELLMNDEELSMILDGNVSSEMGYVVAAIDPLCWDKITEVDKSEFTLDVYMNPLDKKDVRAYFKNPFIKGTKLGYYDCSGKKMNFKKESPPANFKNLGKVVIRLAYSKEWIELQRDVLESIGIKVPQENSDGIQEFKKGLGGRFIIRNGKVIHSLPPAKATSGDKKRYPYVESTRMKMSFTPVTGGSVSDHTITLDDICNVQINKSRVDTSLIHPNLWKTCEKLQDQFASSCYKRHEGPPDIPAAAAEDDTEDSISADASSVESAPARVRTTPAVAPTPVPVPVPSPAPAVLPRSPAATPRAPTPTPPRETIPLPVTTVARAHTEVPPHTRTVPTSPYVLLTQIHEFVTNNQDIDWNSILSNASNNTQPGLAELSRYLENISNFVEQHR